MIIELTLVFDTEDYESGMHVSRAEIDRYAEELNLDTASAMIGYQGWRVTESEPVTMGEDADAKFLRKFGPDTGN